MSRVERFEDLQVWQLARAVVARVYSLSREGAFARDFGLCDQMRRSAVSILSNIAEGFERRAERSFHHFLAIANGSAGELRAQLYVALDLGYIDRDQFEQCVSDVNRIGKMCTSLMQYLRESCEPARTRSDPSTLRPFDPSTPLQA